MLACFVNDLAGEVVVDVAMSMPDLGRIVTIAEMVLGKKYHHLRTGARDRLDDLRRRPVIIQFFARHLPFRIMGVDKNSAREFRDIDRHGALGWFKVTCNDSGRMRPAAPEIRDNHRRRLLPRRFRTTADGGKHRAQRGDYLLFFLSVFVINWISR